MTDKIESLTPAQEVRLGEIRDEWLEIGLSTEPANREAAEAGAMLAYKCAGLELPGRVIWEDSPAAAIKRIAKIGETEQVDNWYSAVIYGQHDATYCAWVEAMASIGVTGLEGFAGNIAVARNAGWWMAYDTTVILTDRPAELHRDALGRLHSETGMAIKYRDGWGFYSWHGRRVPEWVILNPTPANIAAEENTEIRRCGIEAMGWDNFTRDSGLKAVAANVPDPGNPGGELALYEVPSDLWGGDIRLLLVTNGSAERDGTRRRYGLTVPVTVDSPLEAAAWTAGLTGDEYALMARRT